MNGNGLGGRGFSQKKRKFLDHYSSNFIKPSKYLILSQENLCSDKQQDDKNSHFRETRIIPERNNYNIHSHSQIVDDCWQIIFDFVEKIEDRKSMILVCKHWANMFMQPFIGYCYEIYDENRHLNGLTEYVEENGEDGFVCEGGMFFTEMATWKEPLCYDSLEEEEYSGFNWDRIPENQVEFEGSSYRQRILPFGVPLCKETISDQYELVSSEIDSSTYRNMVEKFMGIPKSEQGALSLKPFELYEQIEHEKQMVYSYIHEIQKSLDFDAGNAIYAEGKVMYNDDDFYDSSQNDPEFIFYALRSGIQRLARKAGVKYFEPAVIEDYLYELKRVIHLVLENAYERKFSRKTANLVFEESSEQYEQCYIDPCDAYLPTCDDNLDTDLKLDHTEILESFERITGMKMFYQPIKDPYNLNDTDLKQYFALENGTETVSELQPKEEFKFKEPTIFSNESIPDILNESQIDEDLTSEESEDDSTLQTIANDNFIDDSELYHVDLDNLGDSLQDQLLKVSIRVHEEVYGKERAHKEKLYLKNWYGCSELFYENCSKELDNPPSMQFTPIEEDAISESNEDGIDEEEEEEKRTRGIQTKFSSLDFEEESEVSIDGEFDVKEQDTIERVNEEDLEYFGYALYEDDFDEFPIFSDQDDSEETLEQSSEEESLRYHLRRMLREQSYECIVNYNQ
ncbi:predicted protein [Naegleria gruberi]|uniref:Predicted protein n=1 Tax=Naegleria gruberi TaxID=5762 RepID=D2W299_NAEGR|nr:uncharacterized protein NAEGRDRAFT_75511 [Naegleria gruberi]EFC36786.1 predicted protein [Naegleria gruberi]|eukprot:XP_002669530.1 predicted protein [Naegleria gruberi strain NEG-M]